MWLPGLRAEGLQFVARKLQARRAWRRELEATDRERLAEGESTAQFHSRRVGDAFPAGAGEVPGSARGCARDAAAAQAEAAFRLRDGRLIDGERNVLKPDNGWTPHVSG